MLVVLLFICVAVWIAFKIDLQAPAVSFPQELRFITRAQEIKFELGDKKSGLKSFRVILRQGEYEKEILRDEFFKKGVDKKELKIAIKPRSLGFKEGKATLVILAYDYSIFKNEVQSEREVIIDTQPPQLELASLNHYVNAGGSGLVVYYVSKDATRSGALVGNHFFPGYPLLPDGPYVSYFGLPWDSPANTSIMIEAKDEADNVNKLSVPHLIIKKRFKSDKINISDDFLNRKMPEFSARHEDLGNNSLEVYLTVNRRLREENCHKIEQICQNPSPRRLWEGPFFRIKGAPTSLFGDQRAYYYHGKEIDRQVHLGVDIAALEHYPVGAANRGIVIFTEYLGIYGNTVIIDHGQGLFSMYSHLSGFKVNPGEEVNKGEVIGYTGSSGLAGGDHLHFGMLVEGMPVNPVEWWDPHWIQDNISIKLKPYLDLSNSTQTNKIGARIQESVSRIEDLSACNAQAEVCASNILLTSSSWDIITQVIK
jgi:murein DD-endopeptidase MepM/ murein hydrolase activator NlpD